MMRRTPLISVSLASALAASLSVGACGNRTDLTNTVGPTTRPGGAGAENTTAETDAPPPARRVLPPGQSRPPTSTEQAVFEELFHIAEKTRRLRFRQPVEVRVEDEAAVRAGMDAQIRDDDVQRETQIDVALGLITPQQDLREIYLRVLGEQVIGYYDPREKRLVVRDTIAQGLSLEALRSRSPDVHAQPMVLVHEMVHALQDQYHDVAAQMEAERDTDQDFAYHAMLEGDATLSMLAYLADRTRGNLRNLTRDPTQLRAMMGNTTLYPDQELSRAPAIVRVPLLAAYVEGLVFNASLFNDSGFASIDRAYDDLPASSEQVVHPEKYANGELPDSVNFPDFTVLDRNGYTRGIEDSLGEVGLGVWFQLGSNEVESQAASVGWSGDRFVLYRKRGSSVDTVVWFTAWDDETQAREAEAAADDANRENHAAGATDAFYRVERAGRALLILRNLDPRFQDGVIEAFRSWGNFLTPTPPIRPRNRP